MKTDVNGINHLVSEDTWPNINLNAHIKIEFLDESNLPFTFAAFA